MQPIHIVGRKNHGKTTLILELVEELTRRGLRVGTIKHTSHVHELDTPGKDSHRQRQAGADPAAVVTNDLIGLYFRRDPESDFYDRLAPLFADCEVVLVEGHLAGPGKMVEVWREAVGGPCLAGEHDQIVAVVTNDRPDVSLPLWPRSNLAQLADQLLGLREEG